MLRSHFITPLRAKSTQKSDRLFATTEGFETDCRRTTRRRSLVWFRPVFPPTGNGQPRGITLLELIVSTILLGTVMLIAVPTLAWIGSEERQAEDREDALFEVSNVMEQITARPWDEISPARLQHVQPSEHLARQLSAARLSVSVVEEDNSKRIIAELSWNERTGRPAAPVRITSWVYRSGGTE